MGKFRKGYVNIAGECVKLRMGEFRKGYVNMAGEFRIG
jgi:hypothetical protein